MPEPTQTSEEPRDSRKTTKWFLINEHFTSDEARQTWTTSRFYRLASSMQLTPFELGAFFRASLREVSEWTGKNRFPPMAELHLTMIESSFLPKGPSNPVFPDIT